MSFLWSRYLRALDAAPIVTKSLTVAGLSGVGDCVTQELVNRLRVKNGEARQPYDMARSARMATFGLVLAGPMNHAWYQILEKIVKTPGMSGNVQKLVLDQVVFAPVILSTFFTALTVMEGKSFGEGLSRVKESLLPALKVNYMVWPAAQIINFTFVPLKHRVGYVSVCLFFWNAVLSYIAHAKPHVEEEKE